MKKALITVLILIILAGGTALAFMMRHNNIIEAAFEERGEILEIIYSMDDNPATTPEEVMHYAVNILSALHGNYITEDGLFAGIIYRQRQLFGQEILDLNSFESQYNYFLFQLAERRLNGMYQTGIRLVDIQYLTQYPEAARAHVSQTFENLGLVHWVYVLENEPENGWRIQSWHLADAHFRIIP